MDVRQISRGLILRPCAIFHLEGYSTFLVHVPPDVISLQICSHKVVGV
jgi:hypothetical protein